MNSQLLFPPFKAGPTPMTVTTAGVGAGARGATATGDLGVTTGDPGGPDPALVHKDVLNTNRGCLTRPVYWFFPLRIRNTLSKSKNSNQIVIKIRACA